jgi:hypothetical protein
MTGKIEIIRAERTPVAYVGKNSGAVYFPGRYGKCITKKGEEVAADYSGVGSHIWDNSGNYEPLYEGDIIRITNITKEIVL